MALSMKPDPRCHCLVCCILPYSLLRLAPLALRVAGIRRVNGARSAVAGPRLKLYAAMRYSVWRLF